MDFYDYDVSYNKSMKKKLLISVVIIVSLAIVFVAAYKLIPGASDDKSNDNESLSIATSTADPIFDNVNLDGASEDSLNEESQEGEDSEEESEEASEDNESNNDEESTDEQHNEDSKKSESTQKPESTKKPDSTKKPHNTNSNNIVTSSSGTITSEVEPISTSVPTSTPTVKPTTKPSSGGTENLGTDELEESESTSMYIENPGTLYCKFNGTPNAYLNGYLMYKATDGSKVSRYWSVTLSSSGTASMSIPLESNIHSYTFRINNITLNGVSSSSLSCDVTMQNIRN